MARIKKFSPNIDPHLTNYATFIADTNPNSDYFKITEFKEAFTGGKNGFLIEGSEHLLETTEIKIEIVDVDGKPIYFEPGQGVPEYYEGLSKVIAVYIYEDTPIGTAKITVLGELKTYNNNGVVQDVPAEWKNLYNIKWERTFKVNRLLSNEDKVRFYKRPHVAIEELVKPLFSTTLNQITQTGIVNGTPIAPLAGQDLTNYKFATFYRLNTTDGTAWTGSIAGTNLSIPNLNYYPLADEVINSNELLVSTPYTSGSIVASFVSQSYTASFNLLSGVAVSTVNGSFAKITITDLTTFVGDVARVKVFRLSASDVGDYQFVQEVVLESNELLIDLNTTSSLQEYYGIFTQPILETYWVTSSNSLTAAFNQTYLYDSVQFTGTDTPTHFYTTDTIPITSGVEYSLDFNIRLSQNVSSSYYISAFLSGSRQTDVNGVPTTIQIKQPITTINSADAVLQKSTSTNNIKAETIDNAHLYFEIVGSGWYIANVSFKAAQETAFSPDEITFIQSVPRSLPEETFNYRFEFYDINNNYIPVKVAASQTFNGGNQQALAKTLRLVPNNLYFQFDSASNPVPPTTINFGVQSTGFTGSFTYTSQSFDISGLPISQSLYIGGQYPGLLQFDTFNNPYISVSNFTGSNPSVNLQYVEYQVECEGVIDNVVITKIISGASGANGADGLPSITYSIRPYTGTAIRNNSTASLEVQAVKTIGSADILLSSTAIDNAGIVKLHVLSGSKYIPLDSASAAGFVIGLKTGSIGTHEINYNPIFVRESISNNIDLYLMPASATPVASQIYTSLTLQDLQDGLNSGLVATTADMFTSDYTVSSAFAPTKGAATASFFLRGTTINPIVACIDVYPSMSYDNNFLPRYWFYYTTGSVNPVISIQAIDDNKNIVQSGSLGSYVADLAKQSKNLIVTFTYTEPYTQATTTATKTFTIVPSARAGYDAISFELTPPTIVLNADAKGNILDYSPTITDLKVKQGVNYLTFTSSGAGGTFYTASAITAVNITPGTLLTSTASLHLGVASNSKLLSGSISYPITYHPFFTQSSYTTTIVQPISTVLAGAPPINIIISPTPYTFSGNQDGIIADYTGSNTTIQIQEGTDYLTYTTTPGVGTFQINSTTFNNITASLIGGSGNTVNITGFSSMSALVSTASVNYNFTVHPYSLYPGYTIGTSSLSRTQIFTRVNAGPTGSAGTSGADPVVVTLNPTNVVLSADPMGMITASAYAATVTDITLMQGTRYLIFTASKQTGSFYTSSAIIANGITSGQVSASYTASLHIATASLMMSTSSFSASIAYPLIIYPYNSSSYTTTVTQQITKVMHGAYPVSVNVNPIAVLFPADVTGSVLNYAAADTQITVTEGPYNSIFTASGAPGTFQVIPPIVNGIVAPIVALGDSSTTASFIGFNNMPSTVASASATYLVEVYPYSLSSYFTLVPKTQTFGKGGSGTSGNSAKMLSLTATSQVFSKSKTGALSPSSIVFTANRQNISGATVFQTTPNNLLTSIGDVATLTSVKFDANTLVTVTASASDGVNTYYDYTTIVLVSDGSGAITSVLSNEAVALPADSAGTVLSYSGSGTIVYLYEGSLQLDYTSSNNPSSGSWTISSASLNINDAIITDTGTTATVSDYTQMASNSTTATVTFNIVGRTQAGVLFSPLSKTQTIVKSPQGLPAKNLAIKASSYTFSISNTSVATPTAIVFTSNKQNITAPVTFTSTPATTFTSIGGDSVTLTYANFSASVGTGAAMMITGSTTDGTTTYYDYTTISLIKDGSTAFTPVLSNEAAAIPIDTNNNVISYGGTGTQLYLYQGNTPLNFVTQYPTASGYWTAVTTATNITASSAVVGGTSASYADYSGLTSAGITNGASVKFNIAGTGQNGSSFTGISKIQTFTVVRSGTSGTTGTGGSSGFAGPGVLYRGTYGTAGIYYYSQYRRDVTQFTSASITNYYLANNLAKSGTTGWGSPSGSDWIPFGANFSSVATDILFAQDVYANRTINVGASGSNAVIAIDSNFSQSYANPSIKINNTGYNNTGIFLGYDLTIPKFSIVGATGKYLKWDGTNLSLNAGNFSVDTAGNINASNGSFGGSLSSAGGTFSGTLSGVDGTFTGTLSGANGTFVGTLSGGTITGGTISIGSGNSIFKADGSGIYLGNAVFASAPFSVSPAGALTSTSGVIGGFTIGTGLYSLTKSTFASTAAGVYVGSDGISLGVNSPFKVDSAGTLTATSGTFGGTLSAATGSFTGILNAGGVTIGQNAGGAGVSGVKIDTNNYWYLSGGVGTIKIGDATNNMTYAGGVLSLTGDITSTSATITGATIRTGLSGTTRVVMSGTTIGFYTGANIQPSISITSAGSGFSSGGIVKLDGNSGIWGLPSSLITIGPNTTPALGDAAVAIYNTGMGVYGGTSLSPTQVYINGTSGISVSGTGMSVTAPAFYQSSDKRLKTAIKLIKSDKIKNINSIKFKQFEFKSDETHRIRYGVIAQELQTNFPELITANISGSLSVDYNSLFVLKIEELTRRIIELETKLGL